MEIQCEALYVAKTSTSILHIHVLLNGLVIKGCNYSNYWHSRFAPHAEGCVFESQPRQNKVVKPCSDRPTAKHSVIGMTVTVLEYDHHKRMSLSQYVWHFKEPSLLNGHMHDRVPSIGKNLQS